MSLPLQALVGLISLIGVFLSGYSIGGHQARNEIVAAQKKAQDLVITKANKQASSDYVSAVKVEQQQAKTEVVYRTITEQVIHEIEKPVYRDCVLPPDGLRLWNAANAGSIAETNTTSKPDDNLP